MVDRISQRKTHSWMPTFFSIWGGQAISLLGSQLVQFALVWWLTKTTGSATVLATATLVALLPQVFLGPLSGALVDRWSRRLVMIAADGLTALATIVLAVLFLTGKAQIWHVYMIMFFRSAMGGFQFPAMQASTSLMVPKEHLSRVQGLNQMLNGLMNIGSAPLGALLLGLLPMQGVLAVDIFTALLAIVPLLFVKVPQPQRGALQTATGNPATIWQDVREGFHYVWAWPGLMMITVMASLINLVLVPMNALQPILVTNYFNGQAMQLAWMESAWGAGVVVGGITLSAWGGFRRRMVTSLVGLVLLGISISAVGLVPASGIMLAVVLMFVVGFANPIVNGPLFALVQAVVKPEMQGRVFNLIVSMATAMMPVGLILVGPLADHFGVQTCYVIGGIVTGLLGIGAFFIPAIMNVEEGRTEQETTGGINLGPNKASAEIGGD